MLIKYGLNFAVVTDSPFSIILSNTISFGQL